MVCLACVFITLWVAIGSSVHRNYDTPTPVRYSIPFLFFIAHTTLISIGAGSVLNSPAYALVVNTSGCGSHYLLRQYCTSRYIFGRKVACLSMKSAGTSFAYRAPIRGLNILSGELHWECFCKLIAFRVCEPDSYIIKSSVTPLHILSSSFLSPYHDGCNSVAPTYLRGLRFSLSQCSTYPAPSMCSCS
jgi:hypothetical protein